MNSLNKELCASIIGLVVATIFTLASFYNTDPEVYLFPRIIALMLLLLAAIQMLSALKSLSDTKSNKQITIVWKGLMPGLVITIIYVLVLETIGFYVSAFIAFFLTVSVYGEREAMDKNAIILKFGIGSVLVCILYFLFWSLLNVRTPTGWLL